MTTKARSGLALPVSSMMKDPPVYMWRKRLAGMFCVFALKLRIFPDALRVELDHNVIQRMKKPCKKLDL